MEKQLIAIDYEQSRALFFVDQYFKSFREMIYWSHQTSKNSFRQLLLHERASEYGAQVNYFKDALKAFGINVEQFKSREEAIFHIQNHSNKTEVNHDEVF